VIDIYAGTNGLARAVNHIDDIDRHTCRKHVEKRFSKDRMVSDYEEVYKKMIGS